MQQEIKLFHKALIFLGESTIEKLENEIVNNNIRIITNYYCLLRMGKFMDLKKNNV